MYDVRFLSMAVSQPHHDQLKFLRGLRMDGITKHASSTRPRENAKTGSKSTWRRHCANAACVFSRALWKCGSSSSEKGNLGARYHLAG